MEVVYPRHLAQVWENLMKWKTAGHAALRQVRR